MSGPRRARARLGPGTARAGRPGDQHAHPDPRPGAELAPALPQLGANPGALSYALVAGQVQAGQERRARDERGGVEGHGDARVGGDHQDAAQRGPGDAGDVAGEVHQAVRLLELVHVHQPGDEAGGGGEEERVAGAVDHLEDDQEHEAALTGEEDALLSRPGRRRAPGRSRASPAAAGGGRPRRRPAAPAARSAARWRPAPDRGRSRCRSAPARRTRARPGRAGHRPRRSSGRRRAA